MTDDDLEPAPDPRKVRNPLSRRPERPARVDAVLRSYDEDRAFSIRRPDQAEANTVKSDITAAVYYLNKWEGRDIRVRPYVTEHYSVDGVEYTFSAKTPKVAEGWYAHDGAEYRSPAEFKAMVSKAKAEHYFKTNFWVHDPLPRGFRQMSEEQLEAAHTASAEARGVQKPEERRARPARTVQQRA
jgi:hypothetical protein